MPQAGVPFRSAAGTRQRGGPRPAVQQGLGDVHPKGGRLQVGREALVDGGRAQGVAQATPALHLKVDLVRAAQHGVHLGDVPRLQRHADAAAADRLPFIKGGGYHPKGHARLGAQGFQQGHVARALGGKGVGSEEREFFCQRHMCPVKPRLAIRAQQKHEATPSANPERKVKRGFPSREIEAGHARASSNIEVRNRRDDATGESLFEQFVLRPERADSRRRA